MRTVLIVEDLPETRAWLEQLVRRAFPAAAIETAGTLRKARQMIGGHHDLALVDLGLPDGSGLDLLRQIRAEGLPTYCVVTTVMGDDASVVMALSAGADGSLLKESPGDVLVRQLGQILLGVPPLAPSIARRIMEHFRHTGPLDAEHRLTDREAEVLALIGRGLRNSEVARQLGIAETTVAGYIKSIYRKLGISSRAEAAWHAARMGFTSMPLTHDPE
jgi:DNA-binding NarL/FixJ family response regulator